MLPASTPVEADLTSSKIGNCYFVHFKAARDDFAVFELTYLQLIGNFFCQKKAKIWLEKIIRFFSRRRFRFKNFAEKVTNLLVIKPARVNKTIKLQKTFFFDFEKERKS